MRLSDGEIARLFRGATRARVARPDCPGTETLVAAARGELAGARRDEVAAHFGGCSTCAEEFRRLAAGAVGEGGALLPFRRPELDRAVRRWRLAALAAGLVAAALFALQLAAPRAPGRDRVAAAPSLNVPIVDLDPATVLRGETVPSRRTLGVGPDVELLTLVLNLSRPPAPGEFALELRDARGALRWYGAGLSPTPYDTFTVSMPAALLGEGPVELRLLALGTGEPRVVERYELELLRAAD